MLTPLPPAVYRCILSVEEPLVESSAIYHSFLGSPEEVDQELPFPAWPYIRKSREPICLPTLGGATYFLDRSVRTVPAQALTIAEEYLSRQETIDPEVRETVLALLKDQHILWHWSANDRAIPYFDIHKADYFDLLRKSGGFGAVNRIEEALRQGVIYGNKKNFYGENEAFAYAHESAHCFSASWSCCSDSLALSSRFAHSNLYQLMEEKKLSRWDIRFEWEQFDHFNKAIFRKIKKFEPIEEIFATYIGLRWLPMEVRKKVEGRVIGKLEERGWNKAYQAFAERCDETDEPVEEAKDIFDFFYHMLNRIIEIGGKIANISSMELLYKYLETEKVVWPIIFPYYKRIVQNLQNASDMSEALHLLDRHEDWREAIEEVKPILKQVGIPTGAYWHAFRAMTLKIYPRMAEIHAAIINNDFSHFKVNTTPFLPGLKLTGRPAERYVSVTQLNYDEEEEARFSTRKRVICESLRQQLSQPRKKKRIKIVCPFAREGEECCGTKKGLERLYALLPKEDRNHFEEPDCDSIRKASLQ